jgi:predicted component of type VI protein secretion system
MKLRVMHPAVGALAHQIDQGGSVIGRASSGADIELNWDPRVSRRHARVWVDRGRLWLEDLGSRNGTWHADRRIDRPICFEPGLELLIGESVFSLAVGDEQDAGAITSPGFDAVPEAAGTDDLRTQVAPHPGPRVPSRAEAPPAEAEALPLGEAMAVARRLLDRIENGDLYEALLVPPASTDQKVIARIAELRVMLREAIGRASAPQAARLTTALNALDRAEAIAQDPERRIQYDFRHGHVRAEARVLLARAGKGPSLEALRRLWRLARPEDVDRAAFFTRQAFALRQRGSVREALEAGMAALEHDPFFEELRPTVDAWRAMLERGR